MKEEKICLTGEIYWLPFFKKAYRRQHQTRVDFLALNLDIFGLRAKSAKEGTFSERHMN